MTYLHHLILPAALWTIVSGLVMTVESLASRGVGWRLRARNAANGVLIFLASFCLGDAIIEGAQVWERRVLGHPLVGDLRGLDSWWQIALITILALALMDLGYYVWHRAQHANEWLWRIHAIHHTDTRCDASTYFSTHWLEYPCQSLVIMTPISLLFWTPGAAAPWILGLNAVLGIVAHADVPIGLGPLEKVVVGPRFHRSHHGSDRSWSTVNMAFFLPMWDVLFGTYRDPRDAFDIEIGDPGVHQGLRREMLWPWLRSGTGDDAQASGAAPAV